MMHISLCIQYIYQLPNIQSYSKAFKDPFSKSKDDALKYFFFQSEMLLIKCVCVYVYGYESTLNKTKQKKSLIWKDLGRQ